jgi:hypothetical protein
MKKHVYFSLILLFLIGIYIFNFLTPMWNDDYAACFHFGNSTKERIDSLIQLLSSEKWLYFNWSGGVTIGSIQQFVSVWLGKPIFNLINTLIFGITAYLICFSVNKIELKNILIVLSAIWLFAPVPGETIFWMIASMGYFWTAFLGFLYFLFEMRLKSKIILFMISFIVGSLSLNVSFILIPFYGLIFVSKFFRTKKLDIQKFIVLLGLIFGFLFFFLAPGNMQRYQNMYIEVPLVERLPDFISYLINYLKNISLILFIIVFYLYFSSRKSRIKEVVSDQYFLLFICALLSPIAIIFAPEYSERTTFVAFIFMLPFSLKAFTGLINYIKEEQIKDIVYLIPVFISFAIMAIFIESKLIIYNIDFNNKLKIIEAKKNGKSEVELDITPISSDPYSFIYNIRKDRNYIANQHMAAYFDLKSVRANGDYLKITFDDIIVGDFNLQSKFENGDLYNNSQMVYNKFDGQSVFFDLPDGQKLDSVVKIEIHPRVSKVFAIRGIEICKGSKVFNIPENQIKNFMILNQNFDLKNPFELKTNSANKIQIKLNIHNL